MRQRLPAPTGQQPLLRGFRVAISAAFYLVAAIDFWRPRREGLRVRWFMIVLLVADALYRAKALGTNRVSIAQDRKPDPPVPRSSGWADSSLSHSLSRTSNRPTNCGNQ